MSARTITTPMVDSILLDADAPMSSNDIGKALDVFDGKRWQYPASQRVMAALTSLRDNGQAVKLPHEGIRHGAVYACCDSPEEASRLQLAACEAEMLKVDGDPRASSKGRQLLQALIGLRAMVESEAP